MNAKLKKLKAWRKRNGEISMERLAALAGVSSRMIFRIEHEEAGSKDEKNGKDAKHTVRLSTETKILEAMRLVERERAEGKRM